MRIDEPLEVAKTQYSVLDFLGWQRSNTLNLRPYFQRGSVWTPKAKSYFIDSLLRGYPVPIIFLQNKTDSRTLRNVRQVVDGQQRLRTLLAYIDIDSLRDADERDEVRIMRTHNRDLAGLAFGGLPQALKDRLTETEFSVHVLPSKLGDSDLLQLFARLNSTGERLNDQELRNAEFHGVFKSMAYNLAYGQLDRWRDWGLFTPRALAQMKEVEFTSELMIFLLRGLVGKSKPMIDKMYADYDDSFILGEEVEERFIRVFDAIEAIYTPDARAGGLGELQTVSWFYSLFAVLTSVRFGHPLEDGDSGVPDLSHIKWSITGVKRAAHAAQATLQTAKLPDRLTKALRGASSDRSSRRARFDFLVDHL